MRSKICFIVSSLRQCISWITKTTILGNDLGYHGRSRCFYGSGTNCPLPSPWQRFYSRELLVTEWHLPLFPGVVFVSMEASQLPTSISRGNGSDLMSEYFSRFKQNVVRLARRAKFLLISTLKEYILIHKSEEF